MRWKNLEFRESFMARRDGAACPRFQQTRFSFSGVVFFSKMRMSRSARAHFDSFHRHFGGGGGGVDVAGRRDTSRGGEENEFSL